MAEDEIRNRQVPETVKDSDFYQIQIMKSLMDFKPEI